MSEPEAPVDEPYGGSEPRELADRGVRFIKVPAALLLDPKQSSASDIHPSDLSDLLGRFGGDEFIVMLRDVSGAYDPFEVAERLRAEIAKPVFNITPRIAQRKAASEAKGLRRG